MKKKSDQQAVQSSTSNIDALHTRLVSVSAGSRRDDIVAKLTALGYQVTQETRADDTETVAHIVDAAFDPDFDLTREISSNANTIVLSEKLDFDFRVNAVRAGADAVLGWPLDMLELAAWLKDFDDTDDEPHSIVIVDDDELTAAAYAMALNAAGMITHVVTDPREAVDVAARVAPDLMLMDLNMPDVNGLEVAQVIRQSRQNVSMPIVFLSAERDPEKQNNAKRVGGDEFILKPVKLDELAQVIAFRADRAKALRQVMERDSLTGLLNHARFKERLASELDRSHRTGSPLTVGLIDLDHFKNVNDTYGHQAGDRVIQTLARFASGALRKTDVVARYGGEEFAVILLDTPPEDAMAVLDKVRSGFKQISFESSGQNFNVTLSAGLACSTATQDAEALIKAADDALYASKKSGRNRITIAPTPSALQKVAN